MESLLLKIPFSLMMFMVFGKPSGAYLMGDQQSLVNQQLFSPLRIILFF